MTKDYQPRLQDRDQKIRNTVKNVRKITRLDKSLIAERMMAFAADRIHEIFPDIKNDKAVKM